MGTYIARRLLLMIPTLIGITFLIFMLIALSPGGIGAALRAQGGQMEATSRAIQEAYLEDRYGLDDPVPVQYIRWLARISPIKFGERAQVPPTGERLTAPKRLKPPQRWELVADALPAAEPVEFAFAPEADQEARSREYRIASNAYARARAGYVASRTQYEQALVAYARAIDMDDAVTRDDELRDGALRGHEPRRDIPQWAEVERRGKQAIDAYSAALQSRERLAAIFRAKPFREDGIALLPGGAVSLAAPDFGVSFSRSRPVLDLVGEALPVTLLLNILAFPIIYIIAIPSGMLAATRQGSWIDIGSGALFVAMWSIPVVWAGVLAVGYLANKQYLGLFPVSGLHSNNADTMPFLPGSTENGEWTPGFVLDTLWHLALPVACLVYAGFAVLSKQTRAAMLDNFNADYVRTAKAKGVAAHDIIFRHVFRNSLLPLITMFATIFPAMLAGSVVIERIFSVPGMGNLIIEAIYLRDREVILANTLMIAGVNLLALLLADILYAIADPRISYE